MRRDRRHRLRRPAPRRNARRERSAEGNIVRHCAPPGIGVASSEHRMEDGGHYRSRRGIRRRAGGRLRLAQRRGGRAVPSEEIVRGGELQRHAERDRRVQIRGGEEDRHVQLAVDAIRGDGRGRIDRGRDASAAVEEVPAAVRRDQGDGRIGREGGVLPRPDDRGRRPPSGVRAAGQPVPSEPPRGRRERQAEGVRRGEESHLLHPRRQLLPRSRHRRTRPQARLSRAGQILHRHGRDHPPRGQSVPRLLGHYGRGHRRHGLPLHTDSIPSPQAPPLRAGVRRRVHGMDPEYHLQAQLLQRVGTDDAPLVRHQGGRTGPGIRADRRL
mmetsp:Transcript_29605/g.87765  ORF Transcript_29605/g.87765 Transcript_29605/m.87765 type:complete len:327 (-) Transcript_29605:867-1847(-)